MQEQKNESNGLRHVIRRDQHVTFEIEHQAIMQILATLQSYSVNWRQHRALCAERG